MSDNQTKIEITQDKIIDVLMRAATREDIKELRREINNKQAPTWLTVLLTALLA